MSTFKKLVACSAVSAMALFASADVLYWQVESPDADATFTAANLYVTGGGLSSPQQLASVAPFDAEGSPAAGTMTDLTQTDLGSYGSSDYSFYVELANYTGSSLNNGKAYTWSYNELVSAGYIATNPFDSSAAASAASAGNLGSPTPEPTSGMLLLIGGSLLALRRRRR